MANSSSEDDTDTLPRDPQGYSRISLSLSDRILKKYRNIVSALTCVFHGVCEITLTVLTFLLTTCIQFTEECKLATALTPQTDVTSREAYRK